VAEDDEEILNLAQQILGPPQSKPELPVSAKPSQPAAATAVEVRQERVGVPGGKEAKTAAELAQMIEADLAKHPQCPKDGFQVTVYGASLWRAMLTIAPAAGPIRNPQEWRNLTESLAERLRERYDLDWR
jgi:hypothetical protein